MSARTASWYSVFAGTTEVKLFVLITLRATLSGASDAVHSGSQLPQYENPRQTFHTVAEDSHVINSFPGVVPVSGWAVLNGILQL